MGRPLKINKAATSGGAGGIDIGFNALSSLIDPVAPSNASVWSDGTSYLGVVGGSNTVDTATYPTVKVRVFITGFAEEDGYIIRQKGAHKYLVGSLTSVADEDLVVGQSYVITSLGTTNWQACGAPIGAAVGSIFTCTADAGAGTGTANQVGVCVLTSDLSPTAGFMSISYAVGGDSTEVALSKLTNKYLQGWTGFANEAGTSLTTYADGGNNAGPVNYSGETTYLANFFTDEGTAIKAGKASNGTITLAQVQKYNS